MLAKELHPLTATVKRAVKKVVAEAGDDIMGDKRVKSAVKKMVKKAIKQAVKEVADDAEAKEAGNRREFCKVKLDLRCLLLAGVACFWLAAGPIRRLRSRRLI